MTSDAMVAAVENARARYGDDPDQLDDHLKTFGIHDAGLRSWIVRRIARHLSEVVRLHPREELRHWRPGSESYLAVGLWQSFPMPEWQIADGWIRFAIVRKASLELVSRSPDNVGTGKPMIVAFPDGYKAAVSSRRTRVSSDLATCPSCFTQLPTTGVCDECG